MVLARDLLLLTLFDIFDNSAKAEPLLEHAQMDKLKYRKMGFSEFCAAAISPYQLEALEYWEQIASAAFQHFEEEGNRAITVEELAQVRERERECPSFWGWEIPLT